ncbi:hypothetical protein [Hellea balneolensis]|uniref:hypothetical protein n=1 Tax=Hellea balneolensis TaxID=287478 RepID=UPI0003F67A66|nr:hypothetical protein [Hellea balneolensis]
MRNQYIRKILYQLVNEPTLIILATSWDIEEIDDPSTATDPIFLSEDDLWDDNVDSMEPADHIATELAYDFLNALSTESLQQKCLEIDEISDVEWELASVHEIPIALDRKDLKYWGKKFKWSPFESVILSMGFCPQPGLVSRLKNLYEHTAFSRSWYPFFLEFSDRYILLDATGVFEKNPTPLELIKWMKKLELIIPQKLESCVAYFQGSQSDKTASSPTTTAAPVERSSETESIINPKKLSSLLTLIHAMGSNKPYRYDQSDMKNGAIKRIETAIVDSGLDLSERTIKKGFVTLMPVFRYSAKHKR